MIEEFTRFDDSKNIVKSNDEDLMGWGWPKSGKVELKNVFIKTRKD